MPISHDIAPRDCLFATMPMLPNAPPVAGGANPDRLAAAALTMAGGRLVAINAAAATLLDIDPEQALANRGASAALTTLTATLGCCGGPFHLILSSPPDQRVFEVLAGAERGAAPVVLRDVSDSVRDWRALKENDARFRHISAAALDAIVIMDAAGKVRLWNRAAEEMFGWPAAEMLGRELHRVIVDPVHEARFRALDSNWSQTGVSPAFGRIHRLPARHRDGRPLTVELSLSAYHAVGGWQALGIVRDVSRQAEEEARLRIAEARWKFAIEGGGDAAWDVNIASGECFVSPAYKKMLGYAEDDIEITAEGFFEQLHPEDRARVRECMRVCEDGVDSGYRCEFRMRTREGAYRWIHSRGCVIERDEAGRAVRMVGTHRDVSDQREAEASLQQQLAETRRLNARLEAAHLQLVQSEKLASIGQLAAGVAHEMNTPLGFVVSNFGTLERYVGTLMTLLGKAMEAVSGTPAASDVRDAADRAELDYLREDLPALFAESRDGLSRVQRIVRDLTDFSRVGDCEWAYADIHAGIEATLNILRNEIKYKSELCRDFGPLPELWCVPSQLNQVFMNLILNAAQAIDADGCITVRTHLDEASMVRIEVSDTGCGIAPEHLERIFEPFFTTKQIGCGSGLGLSIAADIARKHGGVIEVESAPGEGSTFRIILPLLSQGSDGVAETRNE